MILGMDVDIPLSGGELRRLLRRQSCLALDRAAGRAALLAQPDDNVRVRARSGGPVEMGHGRRARKPVVGDRPGYDFGGRIIGQASLA